jgi:hypothetical protein
MEWRRALFSVHVSTGGSKTETPIAAIKTACKAHSTVSRYIQRIQRAALVNTTTLITAITCVLDSNNIAEVSVIYIATNFRVEVCEVN